MWWKDLSSAEAFVGAAPKSPGRLHHLPRDLLQQQPLCGTAPCFPAAVLKEMELRFGLCLAGAL